MPEGTSENIYCRPAKWTDVLTFFLANVIAHAFTVPSSPGNTTLDNLEMALFSLFVPYFGAQRAGVRISHGAILASSPLQKAWRAGALCIVGRTWKWSTLEKNVQAKSFVQPKNFWSVWLPKNLYYELLRNFYEFRFCHDRNPENVHGQSYLNKSYAIYRAGGIRVEEFTADQGSREPLETKIPTNYSVVKSLVSIFQIVYASLELYQNKGGQITHYGYGAYSFIVIPYIIMSMMNLLSAIACPEYPALFLVESEIMEEAREHGCIINGTVGRAISPLSDKGGQVVGIENTNPVDRAGSADIGDEGEEGEEEEEDEGKEEEGEAYGMMNPKRTRYDIVNEAITGHISPSFASHSPVLIPVGWTLIVIAIVSPFILVGTLTGFKTGESTFSQRAWLIIWIPFNLIAILGGCMPLFTYQGYFSATLKRVYRCKKLTAQLGLLGAILFIATVLFMCIAVALTSWVFWVAGKSMMENEVCSAV